MSTRRKRREKKAQAPTPTNPQGRAVLAHDSFGNEIHDIRVPGNGTVFLDCGTVADAQALLYEMVEYKAPTLRAHWGTTKSGLRNQTDLLERIRSGMNPPEDLVAAEADLDAYLPSSLAETLGRKRKWTVGGPVAAWNIGALLAGTPNYALVSKKHLSEHPVVKLVVSVAVCGGGELDARSAGILNIIRAIQSTGRSVEVWLSEDARGGSFCNETSNGTRIHSCRILLKRADEPVDPAFLFYWLGQKEALTHVIWPVVEAFMVRAWGLNPLTEGFDSRRVSATPPEMPQRWPDDESTAYIGAIGGYSGNGAEQCKKVLCQAFRDEEDD